MTIFVVKPILRELVGREERHRMTDFDDFYEQLRQEAEAEGPEAIAEFQTLEEHYRLARNVITRRKALGLSQGQLAAAAGIHQSDLSRIEHGRANPTFDTLDALARALGVHVCLSEVCDAYESTPREPVVGR